MANAMQVAFPIPVLPKFVSLDAFSLISIRLTSGHKNDFSRQVRNVRVNVKFLRRMAHLTARIEWRRIFLVYEEATNHAYNAYIKLLNTSQPSHTHD